MKLLSSAATNTKLAKYKGQQYLPFGLSLRAGDASGYEVCPMRTVGCTNGCVMEFSGRGTMRNVQDARDVKTRLLFENPVEFYKRLRRDLTLAQKRADKAGKTPAIRLNVASDIVWEVVGGGLLAEFPRMQFYDYSKIIKRNPPENYALPYSWNERSKLSEVKQWIANGGNVAVVFDTLYNPQHGKIGKLPETWRGYDVIDGDIHDLRLPEFDGQGKIVGLRGKGGRQVVLNGLRNQFIQPTIDGIGSIHGAAWRRLGLVAA